MKKLCFQVLTACFVGLTAFGIVGLTGCGQSTAPTGVEAPADDGDITEEEEAGEETGEDGGGE